MKKIIQSLLFILLCLAMQNVHAQEANAPTKQDTTIDAKTAAPKIDRLIKKDGTPIAGQVIEITPTDVKYKKATNLGGPTYSIPKRNLARIEYASGETEDMLIDLIYKKGGGVLDVKIIEVTDSQIKYTLMDDPDAGPQTMAKNEAEVIEYATGEKINLLPDAIITRDVNTLEVNIVEITYGDIKYKLYNDPTGTVKSISKSKVSSIVYADGKKADYEDWIPFGADNFLVFSDDGKNIITDLTFEDKTTYLCYWNSELELKAKYKFTNRGRMEWGGSGKEGGFYNWQMVADNGQYMNDAILTSAEGRVIKDFNTKEYSLQAFDKEQCIVSPKGYLILFRSTNQMVGRGNSHFFLFDIKGGLINKIKSEYGTCGFRFSHNGSYFLITTPKSITVFNSKGEELIEFKIKAPFWDSSDPRTGPVSFSRDDNYVLSKSEPDVVGVWDLKGNLIKTFEHQDVKVTAFSRDGKRIVTAGNMPIGKVFMRKLENGEKVVVSATGESPVKKMKGVMSDGIKIWSIDGKLIKAIPFPANPTSVEFTSDGKGIAIVVAGSPLWLWEDEDYKLPEGLEKELIQIAKEDAERKREERAERRLNKLFAFAEGVAAGIENNKREMAVFNARMQSRVDQTNREVAAIEQANRPKPVVQTQTASPTATAPKTAKCKYAVWFKKQERSSASNGMNGGSTVNYDIEISNVYMIKENEPKPLFGQVFAFKEEWEAHEQRDDFVDEYSKSVTKGKTTYNYTVTYTKQQNTCK